MTGKPPNRSHSKPPEKRLPAIEPARVASGVVLGGIDARRPGFVQVAGVGGQADEQGSKQGFGWLGICYGGRLLWSESERMPGGMGYPCPGQSSAASSTGG